ncbi:MAG: ABC transporter permease, partial [Vibrionaceae bacterium]|nr:ABC transporter permease [Vibrionaceae bacterium]
MKLTKSRSNASWIIIISIAFFLIVNVIWLGIPFSMAILWSVVDPAHPWSYPDLFPTVLSFGRWVDVWQTTSLPDALRNSYTL